ncbi:hypothetical protein AB0H71_28885 [Nocardia sp. NPDC050697]|uniref:hypothetical protein n=1 Tax=Nocardia sp. NPDC050697 TaxID=3155158 RepID=UPI0033E2C618
MANKMTLDLEVDGAKPIVQMLALIGGDLHDLRGAMQDIGRAGKPFFSGQVFASRGGVVGERWARLSPAYARWKARAYPGRPPLVRSGVMQRSFFYRTTSMSVTFGNHAPYFGYHQSSAERRKIPRRVMLKLTNQFHDDVVRIIAQGLARRIAARSRG